MNERSAGIFLRLLLSINLITAQILFPGQEYDHLVSDLTAIRVERDPPPYQQNQQIYTYQQSNQNYQFHRNDQNYPAQQSQRNYPAEQIHQNYPAQQSNQNYPSVLSDQNYPVQQSQQNSRTQQSQQTYPAQQSQQKRAQQNSPPQQNQQNDPPQQSQQRSTQQSQQKRIRQQSQQNSPPQQSQQRRSTTQESQQKRPQQQSQQNSRPQQSQQRSTTQQSQQKRPQQESQQNSSPQQSQQKRLRQQSAYEQNEQNAAKVIARGFTKLMLDVNRVAPTTSPNLARADNVVYGPVTIAGALAMVLLASIGPTFNEIANLLGLTSGLNIQDDPFGVQEQMAQLFANLETSTGLDIGPRVNFATAIFVQQDFPIRLAYQRASEILYKSNVMNLDFKGNPQMAMDVINTWVSGRTNAKIPDLISDPPPPDTKAIIASVMYFQAAWQFPFFDGGTQWRPFYINGRKKPSDRMALMMSNGGEFPYYKDSRLGVEIMGFPYKGKATTMYVIMPMGSNKEKLKEFENSLTPNDIDYLVNRSTYTEAVVLFPKMKLESTINLEPTLQRLGVHSMFSRYEANLALLSEGLSQRYNNEAEAPFVSAPVAAPSNGQRPRPRPQPEEGFNDRLIFNRFGDSSNCIPVVDPITNASQCQESAKNASPVPLSTGAGSVPGLDTLSNLRQQLIQNPTLANPGLYADQVIHKVYIDITESGTEAAAATGISLNRSGDRVTFRVDVPFLFFIYHEETKVILFWGSVKSPSPTVARST